MRSVVRVLVAIVCLLLLVGGGWLAVALAQAAHLQRQVVRLEEEVRRQEELRKTMAERLGRTRRLGTLRVLQQHRRVELPDIELERLQRRRTERRHHHHRRHVVVGERLHRAFDEDDAA